MTTLTRFADRQYSGGQPTPELLANLAREGVRTVINLRGPKENTEYDEAAEVARLGLRYVALPITGAADIDVDRIKSFGRVLEEAKEDGSVFVHCATSNRVGAMVALDEALNRGGAIEVALERGRMAGLTTLEPAVTTLLSELLPAHRWFASGQ